MLGLYRLLPEVVRTYDAAARGGESIGTLQKIVESLEQELEATTTEITDLKTLRDPDTVDPTYIALMGQLLGLGTSKTWSTAKRRVFLKTIGLLWHIKATRPSWEAMLRCHGFINHFPWELWKTKLHEESDYSLYTDYAHTIKAARVDVRTPSMTTGDQGVDVGGVAEPFRPIHVLIRKPGGTTEVPTTTVPVPSDTDYAGDPLDIQSVSGSFVDTATSPNDAGIWFDPVFPDACGARGLEITTTCVGFCQCSCQGNCTNYCMISCTTGACTVSCQIACTGAPGGCMTGCEASCTSTCNQSCQLTCQKMTQTTPVFP